VRVNEREGTTRRERVGLGPTVRASRCIPAEDLAALRSQQLSEARRTEVTEHLAECAACRQFLARVERPGDEPERIGRYLIRRRLGAGGMGVVYEAEDPHLDRRVAIKVVRPEHLDDEARRRLLREARALAKISHPNVVAVHDVGEHDQQVFVATELVDGETMATWQRGRDWRVLVDAWIQVARGLCAAHQGGIVHRDVKPSNVFVGRDGRVRIGDFGIARAHGGEAKEPPSRPGPGIGRLTVTGAVSGTPGYMAPEQLRGAVDARSDQFALCVAVIEGLTGARPDAGATPQLPGVPRELREALVRGLAADPGVRFATMAELADALSAALDVPVRRSAGARRWIAVPLAGAAITAGIVAALVARSEPPPPVAAVADARTEVAASKPAAPSRDASDAAPSTPSSASTKRAVARARDKRPSVAKQTDATEAAALSRRAKALVDDGKWDEARAVYQRLENYLGYRGEALYGQAWTAFQMNDPVMAANLARQLATEGGPFRTRAVSLYADALFRRAEYTRAKEIYRKLESELQGDQREMAIKKIAACNKELGLPHRDGLSDETVK